MYPTTGLLASTAVFPPGILYSIHQPRAEETVSDRERGEIELK
jgi:hypothetical protein